MYIIIILYTVTTQGEARLRPNLVLPKSEARLKVVAGTKVGHLARVGPPHMGGANLCSYS